MAAAVCSTTLKDTGPSPEARSRVVSDANGLMRSLCWLPAHPGTSRLLKGQILTRSAHTLNNRASQRRMVATQAVSEEAHCWRSASRWSEYLTEGATEGTIPIHPITSAALDGGVLKETHGASAAAWAGVAKFKAKSGELLVVPGDNGTVSAVLLGTGDAPTPDIWAFAALPNKLPPGTFALKLPPAAPAATAAAAADGGDKDKGSTAEAKGAASAGIALDAPAERAVLGWALGCYSFDRYKTDKAGKEEGKAGEAPASPKPPRIQAKLVWPEGADRSGQAAALAAAYYWARDMINTPAEDLGPGHLAAEARAMAESHGASVTVTVGDDLLTSNYPAIHTVGRAAARPPLLIDMSWSSSSSAALAAASASAPASPVEAEAAVDRSASSVGAAEGAASNVGGLPLLALVGKGVCFDSGGLDIKTASGMKMMKKDMGGAALMLALAHVVMSGNLPVRLRVLVPAVENAISGNAYRPMDVLRTRAGITVENGNTDAEGRLILCDALYEASRAAPDLLLDAATLTGTARVALGPDMPAAFTNDDATWGELAGAAAQEGEPLWRLPLYAPYKKLLDSKVADISSTGGEGAHGGAILAALYLQQFAKDAARWVHLDTPAWTAGTSSCAGRPEGAEANGMRALWRFLRTRYA